MQLGKMWYCGFTDVVLFFFYYYSLCLFRAAPAAYGGSQARGPIGTVGSLILRHSHNNSGSEPNLQSTPQLMAAPDP